MYPETHAKCGLIAYSAENIRLFPIQQIRRGRIDHFEMLGLELSQESPFNQTQAQKEK
jgi:hypothetical protein